MNKAALPAHPHRPGLDSYGWIDTGDAREPCEADPVHIGLPLHSSLRNRQLIMTLTRARRADDTQRLGVWRPVVEARGRLRVLLCALTISILVRHQGWAPEEPSMDISVSKNCLWIFVLGVGRR